MKEQQDLLAHIKKIEQENILLKKKLATNQQKSQDYKKSVAGLVLKRTQELEEMNVDLQSAKHELEKYKNHLEDVIRERTIDLKFSEQRFISVSDSLTGGAIFEIKLDKYDTPQIGYLSKSFSDIVNVNLKNSTNELESFTRKIHPEDLQTFQEKFSISKKTKSLFDIEIRLLTPHKSNKYIHIRANAIDISATSATWVGILFDTTEKNKFQKEIQEREAILNAIIETIPYDFWAIDKNGTCFLQNQASKKLWGNIREQTLQKSNIPKKSKNLFVKKIQNVKKNKIINQETILEDIYGNIRDYQTLIAPILLENDIRGYLCFNIDITDRKQEEKARIQNEQKFRNIFDNSTDAIIIQSHYGDVIEMNEEFKKLVSLSEKSETICLNQLLEKKEKSEFFQKIKLIQNTHQIFIFETNFITYSKDTIPVEIKSKEIEYLDSKAILSLIRNTTYRKKFERQLVNTIIETEEKERARLASDLHDDIGPILSSMKMLTGLLKDSTNTETIHTISNQIYDLVTESLRSLRETSNSLSPHVLKNYGIIAATRNIIQSYRQVIEISIDTNCENERFDSTIEIIYYRVLRELLTNTIKHAKATKINISLLYSNDILTFTYKDNGIGFNVNEKTQQNASGMGLYNIINRINSLEAKYTINSAINNGFLFILETNIAEQNIKAHGKN
jgi:PAS domain S-box-containing protein